jgi:sortase (surface protein transpeptidase)
VTITDDRIDQALDEPPSSPAATTSTADGRGRPNPRRRATAVALVSLTAVAFGLVLQMAVISRLQHRAAQQRAYDTFRYELAQGTAPVGQTDRAGDLLALGAPVALLEIPSLGLHEVVGEGSTGVVLMGGPGHRRDTPLPGQAGTSVVLGRAAAYGGPFKRLHELAGGAVITVTTGQGVATYTVTGVRLGGDPAPAPPAAGSGRLVLVTAMGTPFVPSGVLRVDADMTSPASVASTAVIAAGTLPSSEQPLGIDTSTVWALVIWLQGLVVVSVGIVWSWTRWGHHQTWIVFLPLTVLVAVLVADEFMKLLPNLL